MKIVITGAAGFIGSNFTRILLTEHYNNFEEIVLVDCMNYASQKKQIEYFLNFEKVKFARIDIYNQDDISPIIVGKDLIVHFAAESHVDNSINGPSAFVNSNIVGTFNILESMRLKNPQCRLVHVSTDEVYGSIYEGEADEHSELLPNSPYSSTKASSDLICRSYVKTYGLNVIITRCSNNYGPFQHFEKMIPSAIRNILNDKPVKIYGTGLNIREWIHVTDHINFIFHLISKGERGQIYNIGSGDRLNNLELCKLLFELTGKNSEMIEFVNDRPGHDFRYAIDSSKSKSLTGYSPIYSLRNGLLETIEWYKCNLDWWADGKD